MNTMATEEAALVALSAENEQPQLAIRRRDSFVRPLLDRVTSLWLDVTGCINRILTQAANSIRDAFEELRRPEPTTEEQIDNCTFSYLHVGPANRRARRKRKPWTRKPKGWRAKVAGDEKPFCAICYVDYKRNALLRRLPCMHTFHQECVQEWLKAHLNCPICHLHLVINYDKLQQNLSKGLSVEECLALPQSNVGIMSFSFWNTSRDLGRR